MINNQKGVTLLELLVSITLLGIILIPMSNMFLLSFQTTGATKAQIDDRAVAGDIVEMLKEGVRDHESAVEYENVTFNLTSCLNTSSGCSGTPTITKALNNYSIYYSIKKYSFEKASPTVELFLINVIANPEFTPQANGDIEYSVIVAREKR